MLRDLLDAMSRPVFSMFCSVGMHERAFSPLNGDLPLFEHLPTVDSKIH